MDDNKHYQWAKLRYDYYLAGRTLLFNNQLQSAVMMLGYAVEAHLKHLLAFDNSIKKKMQYGHDFIGSINHLISKKYLQDVDINEDLIHFVTDNFDRRYPSQTDGTVKRANARGHAICMAPNVIINYDELILQLDMSVTKVAGTPEASILMQAAFQIDCNGAHYFFHNNFSAISRLNTAIELCEKKLDLLRKNESEEVYKINVRAHKERLTRLKDTKQLLKSPSIGTFVNPKGGMDGALTSVKDFVYPGKTFTTEDGNVVHETKF